MKAILISLMMIFSSGNIVLTQETMKVTGTYDRYEDGIYYFNSNNGESYEFHDITEEASEAYDLMDEALIGKLFSITFTSEMGEEDEMEYNTILSLKMM